jgi:hypothetical protein
MKRSWLAASLLLAAISSLPARVARADDDASAQALVLFNEALAIVHQAKTTGDSHELDDAIRKFLAAYRLAPRPHALFNAALTEQRVGRLADALHHFRLLLRNPACDAALIVQIEKHISDLEEKVAVIQLEAPAGADIAIDGALLGEKAPLVDPIDLMPGKHSIETRMNASASIEIDAAAGTKQTVRIGFGSPPVASPTPATIASAQPQPPSSASSPASSFATEPASAIEPDSSHAHASFWSTRRTIAVAVAGAGVVSLVLSGVFQGRSSADQDSASGLRAHLLPSDCSGPDGSMGLPDCAALHDAYAAQDRDETVSRVFLGVGVGGVLVGAALFFWPQPAAPTHTAVLVPFASSQGGGLRLQGDL